MTRAFTAAVFAGLLVVAAIGAQESVPSDEARMIALDEELRLHPEMGVTDIYKFLYQGTFGPGHAMTDREAVAAYLADEMSGLGPLESADPLCQPLGGQPAMARIHLRPFASAGGDPSALLDAFVASAEAGGGDAAEMERVISKAVTRLIRRSRYQLAGQLEDLATRLADEGFPPVHHSEPYVAAYGPAYRVVTVELARQNGWCQLPAKYTNPTLDSRVRVPYPDRRLDTLLARGTRTRESSDQLIVSKPNSCWWGFDRTPGTR